MKSVIEFYDFVSHNTNMQENLKFIAEKYKDEKLDESLKRFIVQTEIIPLAKRSGFDLDIEKVIDFLDERSKTILKDDIKQVGGGAETFNKSKNRFSTGEIAAAKVAEKSIINSATDMANQFYKQNYNIND